MKRGSVTARSKNEWAPNSLQAWCREGVGATRGRRRSTTQGTDCSTMLTVATRLAVSHRPLNHLSRRIVSSPLENPLRALVAAGTSVSNGSLRRGVSSSSDDREREIEAELSRAPTPTPPGNAQQRRAATEILVNRAGLMPTRMTHEKDDRPQLKGLAKELEQMIVLNGPMTVPEYMIYALQHPKYGYYMRQEDKIGRGGDFITAPEISQARVICFLFFKFRRHESE